MQLLMGFRMLGVLGDAVHRAYIDTLWCFEVADAFGATIRINYIYFHPLRNGLIGAFRLADITIDTVMSDHQGQKAAPVNTKKFTREF